MVVVLGISSGKVLLYHLKCLECKAGFAMYGEYIHVQGTLLKGRS